MGRGIAALDIRSEEESNDNQLRKESGQTTD